MIQPRRTTIFSFRNLALLGLILSVTMVVLLGAMNQIPLFDDKAYLNDGLVFGGRISKTAVQGPFAEERPPLLWWTLAPILATGANLSIVNLLVPIYGLMLMLAVFILAYELTLDLKIATYSTILLGFNSFFLVFSSLLLSDIPGAAIATVFILCLYIGIAKRKKAYLVLAGPILALNIIMRDQNLILVPIALLITILSLRTKRTNKLLALIAMCIAVTLIGNYGLIITLQTLSTLLTPVIIGAPYKTLFTSVAFSPFILCLTVVTFFSLYAFIAISNSKALERTKQCATMALSGELFTLTIFPYLWDNFRLGAEFQIAGKGILARLVAHDIMAVTVGQGMNLSPTQRLSWWIIGTPLILTPTLLILTIFGVVLLIRIRENEVLTFLLPWLLMTIAFTWWQGQIEARYLAPSLPPMAILAGLSARWLEARLKQWFKAIFLPAILLSENIVMHGLSINQAWTSPLIVNAFDYFLTQQTGWWANYIKIIHGGGQLILDPLYALVAFIGMTLPVMILVHRLHYIGQTSTYHHDSRIPDSILELTWLTPGTFQFGKQPGNMEEEICPYCGRQLFHGSRYCDLCGNPVSH